MKPMQRLNACSHPRHAARLIALCLMLCALPATAQELLKNPAFAGAEMGAPASWQGVGREEAAQRGTLGAGADGALQIRAFKASRNAPAGVEQNVGELPAGLYRFRVRVRADAAMMVEARVRLSPQPATVYGSQTARLRPGEWTVLSGIAAVPDLQNDALFQLLVSENGNLLVSEASLTRTREEDLNAAERRQLEAQVGPKLPPVDEKKLLAETDARILKHRAGPLTIRVLDAVGNPLANRRVTVKHLRHGFKFGAAQLNQVRAPREGETEVAKRHREAFLRLFNYATVTFYWGSYEPKPGQYGHEGRLGQIRWLKSQGITPRGHTVHWNQTVPGWIKNNTVAEMPGLLDTRLRQLSQTVLPQLSDADVWNELVQWERFQNRFTDYTREAGLFPVAVEQLKEFKRQNPNVGAVVNDFDSTPATYDLLRRLIEAGAPIDIIGQQTHGGLSGGPKQFWNLLERLSLLQRPILLSELSVLSGQKKADGSWPSTPEGEARQAREAETFYRLAYSHPNVMGIVWWNFSDLKAWRDAPRGFLHADGTPKPAFFRLDNLINKAWRTNGEFSTGQDGTVTIPNAFEGEYEISGVGAKTSGVHAATAPLGVELKTP